MNFGNNFAFKNLKYLSNHLWMPWKYLKFNISLIKNIFNKSKHPNGCYLVYSQISFIRPHIYYAIP